MRFRFSGFLIVLSLGTLAAATPPEVELTRILDTRGELSTVIIDDGLFRTDRVTVSGTSTQGVPRFHHLQFDSLGATRWEHSWGNNDRCSAMTRTSDSTAVLIGSTVDDGEVDYRLMQADWEGDLHGNEAFGGVGIEERGFAIVEYRPDTFLVAGRIEDPDGTYRDLSLARVDLDGVVQDSWSLERGRAGNALSLVGDSVVWVYGTSDSSESGGMNFLMLRTRADSLGLDTLVREFGGTHDDICRAGVRVNEDLTLLVGETRSFSADTNYSDIWIVATNDNGDSLWSQVYGGARDDAALSVIAVPDNDDGFLLAGYQSLDTTDIRNALLLKIDQAGDSLWSILLVDSIESEFQDVAYDAGFHYHAVGASFPNAPYGLYLVTDIDPHAPVSHPPGPFSLLTPAAGDTLYEGDIAFTWEEAIDPDEGDAVVYALLLDADTLFDDPLAFGPLAATNFSWQTDTDDVALNWRVVAQDLTGNLTICGERHRQFLRVIPDSTESFSLAFPDSGEILIQPFSEFRWDRAEDADLIDQVAYDLVFDVRDTTFAIEGLADTFVSIDLADQPLILQTDTVYWHVRAHSLFPEMSLDSRETWSFINWNEPVDPGGAVVASFGLGPVYPNPFNAEVTIPYEIDRITDVRLRIFNLSGRLVETLVASERWPGRYTARWRGESSGVAVGSGTYFVRLTADSRIETAKLIYLK